MRIPWDIVFTVIWAIVFLVYLFCWRLPVAIFSRFLGFPPSVVGLLSGRYVVYWP